MQGHRNLHPASGTGSFQSKPALGADLGFWICTHSYNTQREPVSQFSEMSRIPGSQDLRIRRSQRKLDSQEFRHTKEHWSSDTFKITAEATSFPTPSITRPHLSQHPQELGKHKLPPSQRHEFLPAYTCTWNKPGSLASHQHLQHAEKD